MASRMRSLEEISAVVSSKTRHGPSVSGAILLAVAAIAFIPANHRLSWHNLQGGEHDYTSEECRTLAGVRCQPPRNVP